MGPEPESRRTERRLSASGGVTGRMSRATIEILRDNPDAGAVFSAGGLAAAGFQVLLSRSLEATVYGETFAVLGMLSLLGTPSLVIQTIIARSSARLFSLGRLTDMRLAAWTAARRLSIAAVLLTAVLAALTPLLMRAFQLTSPWPMLVAAVGAAWPCWNRCSAVSRKGRGTSSRTAPSQRCTGSVGWA